MLLADEIRSRCGGGCSWIRNEGYPDSCSRSRFRFREDVDGFWRVSGRYGASTRSALLAGEAIGAYTFLPLGRVLAGGEIGA